MTTLAKGTKIMFQKLTIISAFLLIANISPVSAAGHTAGMACTQVGETELDANQTGVIGCFKTSATDATLVWKSFVSSTPESTTQCYTIKYKSPTDMTFSDPPSGGMTVASIVLGNKYTTHAAVKAVFPLYDASGSDAPYSGIKCINGFVRTACSLTVGGADNDVTSVNNGCVTDDEETAQLGAGGLFITCCKS